MSDNIVSMGLEKRIPKSEELGSRVLDLVREYDDELIFVEVPGAI